MHWYPSPDKNRIIWKGDSFIEGATEWIAYIISKILGPRGYFLNGAVHLSNSFVLSVENNLLYVNGQFNDLLSILMNLENVRTEMSLNQGLISYRVLKMEMAPSQKVAIEIEDFGAELVIVISNVESGFLLKPILRESLSKYSRRLNVSSEQICIVWSTDSIRVAVYIANKVISIIDLETKKILKSDLSGADFPSLALSYFEKGIDKDIGEPINI